MNPMAVKALQSIVRFVLAMLTGWLVTHKIWSESDAAQYLEIGSLAVVTLGWSIWEKYHGLLMIQAARLLPAHTPMVVVKEKADSGTVTTTGPAIAILLALVLGSLTVASCAHPRHVAVVADGALFEVLNDVHSLEQTALCGRPSCAGVTVRVTPAWTDEKSQTFNRAFLPAVSAGREFNGVLGVWRPGEPVPPQLHGLIESLGKSLAAVTGDFPDSPAKVKLLEHIARAQTITLGALDLALTVSGGRR